MRTLNRPMFNMGGPIKQGIMHGIREPYKGGQLVRPGPGRPGYAGEGYFQNLYKAGKQYFNPWKKLKRIQKVAQKIPGAASAEKFLASLPQTVRQAVQTKGIPGSTTGQTFIKNLRDFSMTTPGWLKSAGTTAANWYAKAPKKSLLGTAAVAPYVIEGAKKLPWSGLGDIITHPIKQWGKVLGIGDDEVDKDDKIKSIQENITINQGDPVHTPAVYGKKYLESQAKKVAETKAQRQKNKMLEIMGYDDSKKDAAYNALIDASQIIAAAPGGKSLDISRDIIQPAIAATSKQFDKPKDIKEAVGLLMAKGEIEKEIFQSKGGPLDQQVDTLMKNLNMDKATATRVAKGMPKNLREQITVDAAALKTATTHKTFVNSAKKWYPDAVVWFNEKEAKDAIGSDQKADDYLETVMTEKLTKDPNAKVAGTYIINKELIQIDGAGKANTLFP